MTTAPAPSPRTSPRSGADGARAAVATAAKRTRNGVRSRVHWSLAHGLPRTIVRRNAAKGDLQARMIVLGGDHAVDAAALIEQIREQGPLYRSSIGQVAVGHALVRQVLTSDDFRTGFPTATGVLGRISRWATPPWLSPVEPPSLLMTEPPDHTRYRKLVMRVFTVRAVQRLRERAEEMATQLLDELEASGADPVDIVETYCAQLPVRMIGEILGVPDSELGRVLAYGEGAAPSLDLGLEWDRYRYVQSSLNSFDAWLGAHLERLRREPGDNLLSQLVAEREDGVGLDERELKATAGLVMVAGFETTVNLLSNGIALLSEHRDQLAGLLAEPAGWANAVEEVLRFDPPVLLTGRMVQRETELGGVRLRPGTMVGTILAGANRDPAVFTDPHLFDVTRPNAREHLSFSAGRHHCLGAALARMEGEVGLRMLFERFPDLTVQPGGNRRATRILRGWERLPVRLAPA